MDSNSDNINDKDTVPTLKAGSEPKRSKKRKRSVTPAGMVRRTNCFGAEEFVDRQSIIVCKETELELNRELDAYLDDISREPTKKFRTHKKEKED